MLIGCLDIMFGEMSIQDQPIFKLGFLVVVVELQEFFLHCG